ncbi:hypothetical protein FIBSPDRAFT_875886 [Athelia psychrophila]|uniref:Uncharacterized protein n=1 Tax=Athelia psychrophila TaxID=1759441 RepID=A0A167XDF5_9AGAM|nr:hypothetical protein FIBSPDRAFT_875886 [Fibularhizoctonia sp. CBS 109695]
MFPGAPADSVIDNANIPPNGPVVYSAPAAKPCNWSGITIYTVSFLTPTNATFSIDNGQHIRTFTMGIQGPGPINNISAYTVTDLDLTPHLFTATVNNWTQANSQTNDSSLFFDYAVVSSSSSKPHSEPVGPIVGGVVGGTVLLFALACCFFYMKKRSGKATNSAKEATDSARTVTAIVISRGT